MNRPFAILPLASFLISSCSSANPTATAEPITVQYTGATAPWLAGLYDCAGGNVVKAEQRAVDFQDPQSADMTFRIGQPANTIFPAYKIGNEDILVFVNSQSPITHLP